MGLFPRVGKVFSGGYGKIIGTVEKQLDDAEKGAATYRKNPDAIQLAADKLLAAYDRLDALKSQAKTPKQQQEYERVLAKAEYVALSLIDYAKDATLGYMARAGVEMDNGDRIRIEERVMDRMHEERLSVKEDPRISARMEAWRAVHPEAVAEEKKRKADMEALRRSLPVTNIGYAAAALAIAEADLGVSTAERIAEMAGILPDHQSDFSYTKGRIGELRSDLESRQKRRDDD